MSGKTHVQIALCSALSMTTTQAAQNIIVAYDYSNDAQTKFTSSAILLISFLASAVFGGLLTDIDGNSTISKIFPLISKIIRKLGESDKFILFRHRFIFHSVIFPLLFSAISFGLFLKGQLLASVILLGIAVGYLSHILSDAFVSSVRMYAPFSFKGVSVLHLEGEEHRKTRNKIDKFCYRAFFVANAALIIYNARTFTIPLFNN